MDNVDVRACVAVMGEAHPHVMSAEGEASLN